MRDQMPISYMNITDESSIICSFLPHMDHMSLRYSYTIHDPLDTLIDYMRTWNHRYRPSKKITKLARFYLTSKDISLTSDSIIHVCERSDTLLLKLLIMAGVNVFVPYNYNMKIATHKSILTILMGRRINTSNIFNILDNKPVETIHMLLRYISDNKQYFYSKASRLVGSYVYCKYKPADIAYTYILTEDKELKRIIEEHIPHYHDISPKVDTQRLYTYHSLLTSNI